MKKFLFIFVVLFLFVCSSNALSKFYIGEIVPNMNIGTISQEFVSHNGVPFILRRDDGIFVYCLRHDLKVNTLDYYNEYRYNDSIFKLTDEQLNNINILAYYGYGYNGHNDIKWYGITQFLIWKQVSRDTFFTDKPYGSRILAYADELQELEGILKNYNTIPSFSNNEFEYFINSSYEIIDLNGVLNTFEIKNSNIDSRIENNKLYINTGGSGNYQITLIKKSPINRDSILYYSSTNYQPLIYPGKIKDVEFTIDINVNSGSIKVNNLDKDDLSKLNGSVYNVYKNNELITNLNIENGTAYLDQLELGTYIIKQVKEPVGYIIDDNAYEINITENNRNVIIDLYNRKVKGNLIINKYYGDNEYELEDNAVFEIYDISDNLIGNYETENGVINTTLNYGKYYVVQKEGLEGYHFVDRFDINIEEEKEYEYNLYDKKKEILIVDVPNTGKYDCNYLISTFLVLLGIIIIKTTAKTTKKN